MRCSDLLGLGARTSTNTGAGGGGVESVESRRMKITLRRVPAPQEGDRYEALFEQLGLNNEDDTRARAKWLFEDLVWPVFEPHHYLKNALPTC